MAMITHPDPPAMTDTAETAIRLTDPAIIIAGIRQFGLAADGSDLRDLERAIARITPSAMVEGLRPFIQYFKKQEKALADRGGNPAAMPENRVLHSIPIKAWRALEALASTSPPSPPVQGENKNPYHERASRAAPPVGHQGSAVNAPALADRIERADLVTLSIGEDTGLTLRRYSLTDLEQRTVARALRSYPVAVAKIERLRAALQPFADAAADAEGYADDHPLGCDPQMELSTKIIEDGAPALLKVSHLRTADRTMATPTESQTQISRETEAPPTVRMPGKEIETAARAMCDVAFSPQAWDEFTEAARARYRSLASAALLSLSPQGASPRADHIAALQRVLSVLVIDGEPPALVNIEDVEPETVVDLYEQVSAALNLTPQTDVWQAELRASAASELARDIATRGRPEQEFQAVQKCCERFRSVLEKIARRWPCSTADDMSRLAQEALPSPPQQEKG